MRPVFCLICPMFAPFFPFFCTICLIFIVQRGHLAGIDALSAFRHEENTWCINFNIAPFPGYLKLVYYFYAETISETVHLRSIVPEKIYNCYYTWREAKSAEKEAIHGSLITADNLSKCISVLQFSPCCFSSRFYCIRTTSAILLRCLLPQSEAIHPVFLQTVLFHAL